MTDRDSNKSDMDIVIVGGGPDSGFFARLMKQHDDRRAMVISPQDEETALQLLERLRKEGASRETINKHEGLQALKAAWGGMDLPASQSIEDKKIRMSREYGLHDIDHSPYGEVSTAETPVEVLIKQGFKAPKHHMHLSTHGIPTKRGRKR